jgi:hypothetical protein
VPSKDKYFAKRFCNNSLSVINMSDTTKLIINWLGFNYVLAIAHSPTKPLPSAGILAVMQDFCAGGEYDSLNFRHFPGSK